jgi:hypothetical protein
VEGREAHAPGGVANGGDAELTFLEVFRFAIAADRYPDAEPAAERVIRAGTMTWEAESFAQFVGILAKSDRGDYDGSVCDLSAYPTAAVPAGVKPFARHAPTWRSVRRKATRPGPA